MPPQQKSVLVTGCRPGSIGDSLAQVFHEKGYRVFATVRNPSTASRELTSAANVTVLPLDLLSPESVDALVERVKQETGGRLDVLINNSGQTLIAPALDLSVDEARRIFDLNFWGPLTLVQALAPLLVQAQGGGCVVNNTSVNAYIPMPFMTAYNASKAALASASETWRRELEPLGVRVITLVTGAVNTKIKTGSSSSSPPSSTAEPPELPEGSYYRGVRHVMTKMAGGSLQDGAISPRQYALQVVRDVEKGANGVIWAGTNATFNRLAYWLSPQSVLEMGKVAKEKKT
ncbi:short-chain dehydrogenase/reductase [Xylariomycetidae sp. FL2044]|nr:short-chain dehydrogenase/reductase [Xylariomycetidae sp. FL2044]